MDFFDVLLAKKLENDQDPTIEGLSVTENGRYEEEGVVYKPVIVNVPQTTIEALNVTANGEYTAPSGKAYSPVNVNVPLPQNAYLKKSVSGLPQPIASLSDGADAPLNSLKVNVDLVQTGSGEPSPSNVRPIVGWSGANISVNGVNQWDEEWEVGKISSNGSVDDDSTRRTTGYINVLPNTTYYMQCPSSAYSGRIAYFNANKELVLFDGNGVSPSTKSFTTPNNVYYVRITIGGNYGTTYNNDISINYPSTDTSYHAYNGHTYSIPFGQTVYEGVLDVTGGVLTATHTKVTLDGNSNITTGASSMPFKADILTGAKPSTDSTQLTGTKATALTEVTQSSTWGTANTFSRVSTAGSANRLFFKLGDDITTTEQAITYLTNNPIDFVYELATPITIQLTPTQVRSLANQNNIFSDTGDVTDCEFFSRTE